MGKFRWTPDRMDQLENAVRRRKRVAIRRRGNEYVVIAVEMKMSAGRDALSGFLPMTGEELLFVLDELEHFQVIEL
jgi:hypothetical protein